MATQMSATAPLTTGPATHQGVLMAAHSHPTISQCPPCFKPNAPPRKPSCHPTTPIPDPGCASSLPSAASTNRVSVTPDAQATARAQKNSPTHRARIDHPGRLIILGRLLRHIKQTCFPALQSLLAPSAPLQETAVTIASPCASVTQIRQSKSSPQNLPREDFSPASPEASRKL